MEQKGKSMKIYISNAADRDEVVVILARNGYTVRQGSEKVEGQKVRKSFVEYSERSAKE